jgi:hypothetical protein
MTETDFFLQRLYFLSQTGLFFVAVAAVLAALMQVRAFKLLELLKLLENPEVRNARRIVIRELYELRGEPWWQEHEQKERFEQAASHVCATYDTLGQIRAAFPMGRIRNIFQKPLGAQHRRLP